VIEEVSGEGGKVAMGNQERIKLLIIAVDLKKRSGKGKK